MDKNAKIFVAGHKGLAGSAIVRRLIKDGYQNLILKTKEELDLTNQGAVANFFIKEKPEYVFLAAAKVGGILANSTYPAEFIYQNLQIQNNVIHQSYLNGVKKLLFLGSSCIYPKLSIQPIKEEYLLTGALEPTNEAYAIAKISGLKLCEYYNKQYGTNYISVMPTNLYGINDNFDPKTCHVLPALIQKFHEAKINEQTEVMVWGTGKAFREFLFVDDLADACVFLMKNYSGNDLINIGTGQDMTIKELAEMVKEIVNYQGKIVWDTDKPDGTPRKLLDTSKLKNLGWVYKTEIKEGLRETYNWYLSKIK